MKKKIILFSLLASLIIGMTACNNENSVPEVTEQTISISETVTEKTETTSQSETGTEKTETTETSEEAKTTLTVNDETHATVKEENVTESVTNEKKEENKNQAEEFSYENLIITIGENKYQLPIHVKDLNMGQWSLEQAEPNKDREVNENGYYTLFGSLYESGTDNYIRILVESKDKIISSNDKITMLAIYSSSNWSVGKIQKGMSRDEVNSIYSNFTTEGKSNLYVNGNNEIMYISYNKFDKVSSIAIKGI